MHAKTLRKPNRNLPCSDANEDVGIEVARLQTRRN